VQVLLVQRLDNGHKYALKILKKSDVYKRNQIAHTNTEKNILSTLQASSCPPPPLCQLLLHVYILVCGQFSNAKPSAISSSG
jgi:serine/threonine protein kinase